MPAVNNAIYDEIHETWWNEDGFMAILRTAVSPGRFAYFQEVLTQRLRLEPRGLRVLDIGCGGGFLSEQFAALGCEVTGVDRSRPTLAAAAAHAEQMGLAIRYEEARGESLPFAAGEFDIVCCCDVLEHVDDVEAVVAEIARVLKPGGVFLFDTINRTRLSKLVAIKLAQDWPLTRFMPRDVHVWEKFIRPEELAALLEKQGLASAEMVGLGPGNPLRTVLPFLRHKLGLLSFAELGARWRFQQSRDLSISYMGFARRG